jgi:hypothetical protein
MLYLLDANVLIDANRDYYPVERIPEFWDWLEYQGGQDKVKVPVEIYHELKEGTDDLAVWIKQSTIKQVLLYSAEPETRWVSYAVANGYASDLTDVEIEKLGRDPFLLGYALADPMAHCIVTTEGSRPTRERANRHLPDAAKRLGIETCNTFELTRRLDFRTSWRQ